MLHHFPMDAALHYLAMGEDDDFIAVPDSGQPMGHNQMGSRALVASSSTRIEGFTANARAISSRWR